MATYQLYLIEPTGPISSVVELNCADDKHAIEAAGLYPDRQEMVLWQEQRRVKIFPKISPSGHRPAPTSG